MFPYEDSKTVSVWPYPEKRRHHSFVNISPTPTLVIDASMERSSRVPTTTWKYKNLIFFFKKVWNSNFWLVTKSWNHPSFVNISPTLVINTSMERSSQFLAYAVHNDWCYHSIHKHSSRSQHAPIWCHRGSIVVPLRVDI